MGDLNRKDSVVNNRGRPTCKDKQNKDTTCTNDQKKQMYTITPTIVRGHQSSPRIGIRSTDKDMDQPKRNCCRACQGKQENRDWILCDMCDYCYHGTLCEGLTTEQLQKLLNKKLTLKYLCTFCKNSKNQASPIQRR